LRNIVIPAFCLLLLACAHGSPRVTREEPEIEEIMVQVYRADLTPETGPCRFVIRSRSGHKLFDAQLTREQSQHIHIGFWARKLGSQLEVTVPLGKFSDRGAFSGAIVQFGYTHMYCVTLPHTCTLIGD